jgi:hypothetical protein
VYDLDVNPAVEQIFREAIRIEKIPMEAGVVRSGQGLPGGTGAGLPRERDAAQLRGGMSGK